MKRLISIITGLVATLAAAASVQSLAGSAAAAQTSTRHGFDRFVTRYEAANTAFVNGDPTPWLSITADQNPASIFGGFGGLGEAGAGPARQRYLLAASAFRPSGAIVAFEYLVKDVHGRLAYTVAIERADVLYAGHTDRTPQILRVTMLFRFDRGAWQIVHRHADTMINLELPGAPAGTR